MILASLHNRCFAKDGKMKYCIYLRKSRADVEAEARGEGETSVSHVHALLELA